MDCKVFFIFIVIFFMLTNCKHEKNDISFKFTEREKVFMDSMIQEPGHYDVFFLYRSIRAFSNPYSEIDRNEDKEIYYTYVFNNKNKFISFATEDMANKNLNKVTFVSNRKPCISHLVDSNIFIYTLYSEYQLQDSSPSSTSKLKLYLNRLPLLFNPTNEFHIYCIGPGFGRYIFLNQNNKISFIVLPSPDIEVFNLIKGNNVYSNHYYNLPDDIQIKITPPISVNDSHGSKWPQQQAYYWYNKNSMLIHDSIYSPSWLYGGFPHISKSTYNYDVRNKISSIYSNIFYGGEFISISNFDSKGRMVNNSSYTQKQSQKPLVDSILYYLNPGTEFEKWEIIYSEHSNHSILVNLYRRNYFMNLNILALQYEDSIVHKKITIK